MADNDKRPLPVFFFKVHFDSVGVNDIFFKSVSGLRIETEVVDVRAGGVNNSTFRLPGATKWSNLVFKQGFAKDSSLLTWRDEWIQSRGRRTTGNIQLCDTAGTLKAKWSFVDGWPCKWEISEFDAGKTELAIETLEIVHHGLSIVKV